MVRAIVEIDQAKCDGCGLCVGGCAEGAIALVDGKARLVSEVYCDGLGACLEECPRGALRVVERDAPHFDEAAVASHLARLGRATLSPPGDADASPGAPSPDRPHPGACPGSAPRTLRPGLMVVADAPGPVAPPRPRLGGSALANWPIQLHLAPSHAPWLAGADLLVSADCVPFAYAGFHTELLPGRALLVGCPKLDDTRAYAAKLADICGRNEIRSITVARLEVPCCGGLAMAVRQGVARSGRTVPIRDVVLGIDGGVRQR